MPRIIGKLGKLPAKRDSRMLKLGSYLTTTRLPVIPGGVDWGSDRDEWGMLANDRLGDCTCAAALHLLQIWTHNCCGEAVNVTDADAIDAYSGACGYVPGDPSTDNGGYLLDVLRYWQKTGIAGRKILAYVSVDPTHHAMVRAAEFLFGGLYCGFDLPLSAQGQDVWDWEGSTGDGKPGSWGGHAVNQIVYGRSGQACITWGGEQRMTWSFWDVYCDEAYAVVSEDWLDPTGKSPPGFDLERLLADVAKVTG